MKVGIKSGGKTFYLPLSKKINKISEIYCSGKCWNKLISNNVDIDINNFKK